MKNSSETLGSLNQALRLEYSLIVHYPRIASSIQNEETRNLVLELGTASIKHADVVARAIRVLGGNPVWSFEPFPEGMNLVQIFQAQLEKEKLALRLHTLTSQLVQDISLKAEFSTIAKQEESHIRTIEKILSKLG